MVKHKVTLENGAVREVEDGTPLEMLSFEFRPQRESAIVAAKIGNALKELTFPIQSDCSVKFLDLSDSAGARIYERSLVCMLVKAVLDLFPGRSVNIKHSVNVGVYAEVVGEDSELLQEDVDDIEARMKELSKREIPFIRKSFSMEEARGIFKSSERVDLYNAIKERNKPYVIFYDFGGHLDYFYGYMAPHSGYVNNFSLIYNPPGLVVMYPNKFSPTKIAPFMAHPKLSSVFSEFKKWGKILGVENIGELNALVRRGEGNDIIKVTEALQEKRVAQIADMIAGSGSQKKIVFISGPSSSGKTTFSNRLSIQLRVNGFKTHAVPMDHYYLNREDTPIDEDGEHDLECPEALDLDLFISHMLDLAAGKTVEVPTYSFHKGAREDFTNTVESGPNHIIIVEGIHGLNNKVTSHIPEDKRFKVYISALTTLNIDNHNRIPTTDSRLIRRIVRDNQFRGSDALSTMKRWPSVRRGEKKHIFPFQETCDIMFNSALIYELGALKGHAMPLLEKIGPESELYSEAVRLTKFLSYFAPIDTGIVPYNSILREFIGGSCFNV